MSSRTKVDTSGLKSALREFASDKTAELQRAFDRVWGAHSGGEVETVLCELQSAARDAGWNYSAEELQPFAEAISAGTRVRLNLRLRP